MLAAAALALGSCLALAVPAGSAAAAPANPVPTVFSRALDEALAGRCIPPRRGAGGTRMRRGL
ncbi:hypothetical protein [Streptomyces sp. NPDC060205]|uniref:hypothetical protein n=1 Tax=Streptomyces sp. NPDC060205 TaxID=3347072 RepID=UPI003654984D